MAPPQVGDIFLKVLLAMPALLLLPLAHRHCRARRTLATITKRLGLHTPPSPNRIRGGALVLLVALLYSASTVTTQLVFEEERFEKPLFLTYVSFSTQALYLLAYPAQLKELFACARVAVLTRSRRSRGAAAAATAATVEYVRAPLGESAADAVSSVPHVALSMALRLGALLVVGNLAFNAGLESTSASSATVIACTSSFWTLLFSSLLLGERMTQLKMLSAAFSVAGVAILVAGSSTGRRGGRGHDHDNASVRSSIVGNAFVLLSAVGYGLYTVRLKQLEPEDKKVPLPLIFGLMGMLAAVFLWPLLAIAHVLHIEHFREPSWSVTVTILLNATFGVVLANVLLARATLLSSPIVTVVGLSLSIPLSTACDVLRGRTILSLPLVIGSVFVWISFVLVALGGDTESDVPPSDMEAVELAAPPPGEGRTAEAKPKSASRA